MSGAVTDSPQNEQAPAWWFLEKGNYANAGVWQPCPNILAPSFAREILKVPHKGA
jgi:hypothetical protein